MLTVVVATLVAVLLFVAYPPADLMRRAALPLVAQALGHPVELGAFELRLGRRGHIELRDLTLPPLPGYKLPLMTLARLTVDYDARAAAQGKLVVKRVEVAEPTFFVEAREGKLNWLAFLEKLSQGEQPAPAPEAVEEIEAPAESAQPAPFEVVLERFAVTGIAAYVQQDGRTLLLDGLDITAQGRIRGNEGNATLRVKLARRNPKGASIALALEQPQKLQAYLDTRLEFEARLTRVKPLAATFSLALDVGAQRVVSAYTIPPLKLALRAAGGLDQKLDRAHLKRFALHLDGKELLDLRAVVDGLQGQQRVDANVVALTLPISHLGKYARAFFPALEVGGALRVRDLKLRATLSELGKGLPPQLSGRVELDKLRAKVRLPLGGGAGKGAKAEATAGKRVVELQDLSGSVRFAAAEGGANLELPDAAALLAGLPEPGAQAPLVEKAAGVRALVELHLANLRASGARVGKLDVSLATAVGMKGLTPQSVAGRLRVALAGARYHHPSLGPLRASTRLAVDAHAHLPSRAATLQRLDFDFERLLRLQASAVAEDYQRGPFRAHLKLAPLSLSRLLSRLPAKIRRGLPLSRLNGRVGLELKASGRPPRAGASPLALPLHYDARLALSDISATLRGTKGKAGPSVEDLDSRLRLRGRPGRIELEGGLSLAKAHDPSQGVTVGAVQLSKLTARISPKKLDAGLELAVGRVRQDALGMRLDQRGVRLRWGARAALGGRGLAALLRKRRAPLGKMDVTLEGGFESLRAVLPGVDTKLTGTRFSLGVKKTAVAQAPLAVKVAFGFDAMSEAVQKLNLNGLALDLSAELENGLEMQLPAMVFTPDQAAGRVGLKLRLAKVRHPALPRALRGTRLDLRASWPLGAALALEELALRVPSFGAHVRASGRVRIARYDLAAPARLIARGLPEMRVQFEAGLRSPKAGKGRLALVPGVSLRGAAGVKVALATLDRRRLAIDGKVWAKDFFLRQQASRRERVDGRERRYARSLNIRGMRADIPLKQTVELQLAPFAWKLPPPKRSIFDGAAVGATYRMVRPFLGRGPNLSLDGIRLVDRLEEGGADGKRRVSESTLEVGRTLLDLQLVDSTVLLDRLYIKLFGGDIFGAVQVQLPRLAPFDLRLRVDTRLTSIDFAHLDAQARARGESAKVSALVRLKTHWSARDVSGRVLLTDISMKTLDSLLAFLDPHGLNESLQANRRLLSAWYTKMVDPEVRRVSVWIDHSRLNLDLSLGALWPFGAILRQALSRMRIRRVSLKPFLPQTKKKKDKGDEKRKRRPAARRGRGRFRVR